eukprot:comp19834_c0_seq1/m.38423 comp19834_c0_seq1/g.38423  ORF comp19834_c0_seq1/g.38423 comp19834_c0_seq1/m.38423 type:complete len:237 (+) comp19834_c0_seq1:33-743(+)
MNAVPWFAALEAAIRKNQALEISRYCSIATCSNNVPSVRTVRFLGFSATHLSEAAEASSELFQSLLVRTDTRAQKARDVRDNPVCEIAWYFPMTREQFRLSGKVVLADAQSEGAIATLRTKVWKQLAPQERDDYANVSPGELFVDLKTESGTDRDLDLYTPQHLASDTPVPHFALLIVIPSRVDYLTIPPPVVDEVKPRHRDSPRESLLQANKIPKRFLHTRNEATGVWEVNRVNP